MNNTTVRPFMRAQVSRESKMWFRHSEGLNIPKVFDFYSHERFYSSPFLVRAGKSGSTERNTGPMEMWEKTGGMRRRGREIGAIGRTLSSFTTRILCSGMRVRYAQKGQRIGAIGRTS